MSPVVSRHPDMKPFKRAIKGEIERQAAEVDHIARALYEAADTGGASWEEYIEVHTSYLEVWRDLARAAIKAMQ